MSFEVNWNPAVPGETDGLQFSDKQIMLNADVHIQDRIPVTIAPNTGDLDMGTVLGVSTADGLFRPVIRITVTATAVASPQVLNAKIAGSGAKFAIGQNVSSMNSDGTSVQALGTITAINGDAITVQTELTTALVDGSYLYVSDGSQKAVVVLGDVVWDAAANKISNAYVAGKFIQSRLVGVDALVISDLHARSIPYSIDNAADNILVV